MSNIYLRSTDGLDTDNGSTWALAKATIAGATASDAAGDTIFVSQSHAESSAADITVSIAGSNTTPSLLICGNDAAEPPTATANTASITTTGTAAINLNGSFYAYGITFNAAGKITTTNAGDSAQTYDGCTFQTSGTGSGSGFNLGLGATTCQKTTFKNHTFKFGGAGNVTKILGDVSIVGGTIGAGSSTPANLFMVSDDRQACSLTASGMDLSSLASTFNIFAVGIPAAKMLIRNSKLPASWSGLLVSGTIPGLGQRYEMHNCDAGDTNYRLWVEDYAGSIKSETTIIATGGASDGTTGFSWKMASSSKAKFAKCPLESIELPAIWNSVVGSSKTVTVEIVHDSVTNLTDDEVYLEVQYLGTSGYPLGSFVSDAKASVLATAADQTTSTQAWTTTGLTNPNKQKLSVTITPQKAGYIQAKVILCKASKTIYVDPRLTVA